MKRFKKYSGPIPGYWTNTVIYMIKGKVNITDKTSLTMTYQYLTAPDSTPSTGVYALSQQNSPTRARSKTTTYCHTKSNIFENWTAFCSLNTSSREFLHIQHSKRYVLQVAAQFQIIVQAYFLKKGTCKICLQVPFSDHPDSRFLFALTSL